MIDQTIGSKHFSFKRDDVVRLAQFIAQLTISGVEYVVRQDNVGWEIELTGGY
jgi:hypothetical protein